MSILDDIRSIEYDRNRKSIFGIKSAIIWGHSKSSNSCSPLLYISKPKSVSKEDFEYLLDRLKVEIHLEPVIVKEYHRWINDKTIDTTRYINMDKLIEWGNSIGYDNFIENLQKFINDER